MKQLLLLVIVSSVLTSNHAFAWSATGHQTVAQIAYDRLNPTAKSEVDRLIDVLAPFPPRVDHFVPAATWMDQSRGYDIGMWDQLHFISLPYNPDGLTSVRQPAEQNVVWAIQHAITTLKSGKSQDLQKALMLRMLIHFVGDIHQPLHATERFSGENPNGERGGNLFAVQITEVMWEHFREMNPGNPSRHLLKQPTTLHGIWDEIGLLYPFVDPNNHDEWSSKIPVIAAEIVQRHPSSSLTQVFNSEPMAWAKESNDLGINAAYRGVKIGETITKEYFDKTHRVATKQIALAGYRLARVLNEIYPHKP